MAKIREGARNAPRHEGELYDRGYQFRYPEHHTLEFGPWDSIWPLGERQVPKNTLRYLYDGILYDGVIYPIWSRSTSTVSNQTVVGTGEFPVAGSRYHLNFYKNIATGLLNVKYDNGQGDVGSTNLALAIGVTYPLSLTPWGAKVYFTQPSGAGLLSTGWYNPISKAFASVAAIPLSKFIFILDNNLVYIREMGSSWEIGWSVDGNPEDLAGAGSGTKLINNIGVPRGVAVFEDRAIIIGSAGAVILVPTGTADPSFRIMDVAGIKGTPFDYAVAADRESVYYVGYNRQLTRMHNQGTVEEVGFGEGAIDSTPVLYFSNRLGNLIVSQPTLDITWFLDTKTKNWVSSLPVAFDFLSDVPSNTIYGKIFGFENVGVNYTLTELDLNPSTYTIPAFGLGKFDLQEEWLVEYLDVERTDMDTPAPFELNLTRILASNVEEISSFISPGAAGVSEIGHTVRYYITAPAQIFIADFELGFYSGPYVTLLETAEGNIPVDPTNPPAGLRGEITADGNISISTISTSYVGDSIDANGNMILTLAPNLWTRNVGIEKVKVQLQRLKQHASP